MTQTYTIRINNFAGTTLAFESLSEQGVTISGGSTMHNMGFMVVTLTAASGSFQGKFLLKSGFTLVFEIDVRGLGPLRVGVVQAKSNMTEYVAGVANPVLASEVLYINLYAGRQVGDSDAYVVPLSRNPFDTTNNCPDFVNSLFEKGARADVVQSLVAASGDQGATVPYIPADLTAGQFSMVVQVLMGEYQSNYGPDLPMLQFLASYLVPTNAPPMKMWVPQIAYDANRSASVGMPCYALNGYTGYSFTRDDAVGGMLQDATVRTFFNLLVGGAHFVAISATDDLQPFKATQQSRSLLDAFDKSGLPSSRDPGSSHYADAVNLTGRYYLDIQRDWAGPGSGLMLALLFGSTVNSTGLSTPTAGTYNTFMQLEGWQAYIFGDDKKSSDRHNADFAAHKKSLWNFSTFGASPYSEKRATTVFLAPPAWTPSIYQTTFMMPYVGSYPIQIYTQHGNKAGSPASPRWLHSSVVSVPQGTPALPPNYIGAHYLSPGPGVY